MRIINYLKSVTSQPKLRIIQAQRLIAALMVVVCHCSFYTSERLNDDHVIYSEGSRGVALFFVISGFVMMLSTSKSKIGRTDWLNFILRRLVRIAPLYWAITTVKAVTLIAAASLVLHAEFDIGYIVRSYFFVPSLNVDGEIKPLLGVGWTLVYEMFFYLVFTVALLLRRNPFVISTVVMSLLAVASLFRTTDWPVLAYFFADTIVLDFVFGMIAAKIILSSRTFNPALMLVGLTLGLLALFAPQDGITGTLETAGVDMGKGSLVVGIVSAIVIWASAGLEDRYGHFVPTPVLFFGAASYSLYLIHPMVGPIAPELMARLLPWSENGVIWFWISSLAGVALALVAATSVYLVFEEPMTRFLNRRVKVLIERLDAAPRTQDIVSENPSEPS